ncbi:MAG: DUF2341 domain-containing protein, partial [Candidatus Hodarchaeales archaeon]
MKKQIATFLLFITVFINYGSVFTQIISLSPITEDSYGKIGNKNGLSSNSDVMDYFAEDQGLDEGTDGHFIHFHENGSINEGDLSFNHTNYSPVENIRDPYSGQINTKLAQIDEGLNYHYKKNITINHDKVDGNLTNFPVLVDIYDSDLHGDVQNDGDDIIFTSDTGEKLDHEVELFERKYNKTHAHLVAWIKVPLLSSESDTVIFLNYGNSTVGDQQNPDSVWDSDFSGVWHLNDDYLDSTANNNDGTNSGSTDIESKIAGGNSFDGDDSIQIPGLLGNPTNLTLSAWVNLVATDTQGAEIISIGDYAALRARNSATDGFYYYDDDSWAQTTTNTVISGPDWHYIVYTINSGISQFLFIDGSLESSTSFTDSILYSGLGSDTFIGKHGNGKDTFDFNGAIDEVRVSKTPRSNSWITTEYNNQFDPGSFYSISGEYLSVYESEKYIYSKNITINHNKVDSSLKKFPFLIDIYDSNLRDNVQSDGDDIIFTDVTGEKLAHDIEIFNQTYNDSFAHLVVWVNIPELSSTTDTVITMCYGNSSVSSQEDPNAVWDDYTAVWHLNDSVIDEQTTSNAHLDSTGNGYNGDQSG